MPISKMQSESVNLADNFAFTGTVTGAGGGKILQVVHGTRNGAAQLLFMAVFTPLEPPRSAFSNTRNDHLRSRY